MEFTDNTLTTPDFDRLLRNSRERIAHGDTYLAIERYLQSQQADKEVIDSIFAILVEEERLHKLKVGPTEAKKKRINIIIFNLLKLIGGAILAVVSYNFLNRGMNVGYIFFCQCSV